MLQRRRLRFPQQSSITNRLDFGLQIDRIGICAVPKVDVAVKKCLRTDLMNVRRQELTRSNTPDWEASTRTICGKK